MEFEAYPIQCIPILKERLWGGTKLKTVLEKEIPTDNTGESWELSTVEDNISIIANGIFAQKKLTDILSAYPEQILGSVVHSRFGNQFPLLFKFLDAQQDLSIQVHPNDELARKRHNEFGKTEMWYVMQADPGSQIIVGFKENSSPEHYLQSMKNNTLLEILDQVPVQAGDVFLLEAGTVHSLGAGTVVAEIQQTSDITYRIYDFDRKDANGNPRELHVDLALEAINYEESDAQKIYERTPNVPNPMVVCDYFTTNYLPLDGIIEVAKSGESFTVYMCVEGGFSIASNGSPTQFKKGDTVLIPAAMRSYSLSGTASLLEIYIS